MYPCPPPGLSPWTGAFPQPAPFPPAALGRVARLWVSLLNAASSAARLTPSRGPAWGLGLDPLAAPCLRPSRGPSSQHARAGVSHMDTQSLSGSFSQPHLGPPWDGGPGLLLGSGDQNWMWQGGPGPPSVRARGFQGHPGRTPRPAGQASACPGHRGQTHGAWGVLVCTRHFYLGLHRPNQPGTPPRRGSGVCRCRCSSSRLARTSSSAEPPSRPGAFSGNRSGNVKVCPWAWGREDQLRQVAWGHHTFATGNGDRAFLPHLPRAGSRPRPPALSLPAEETP